MRRSPRLIGTVGLLILALVVAAALAYQAWDAARSQQRTAESTLTTTPKFADWQLTQQAKNALLTQVITSLMRAGVAAQPGLARADGAVARRGRGHRRGRWSSWCDCLSGVQYFFRYDWHDGTFRTTETELPDADLAWARDTMVAYAKALAPLRDRQVLAFGSPDGRFGPFKNLAVVLTNDSYAMLFGERNKKPLLVVFVVARDASSGLPVVVYGYVTDPKPFLAPAFASIRGGTGRAQLAASASR